MSSNYYDVVVLGMELGSLCAGALLAKRGFRVLVVGQNGARDTYSCFDYQFIKRPFLMPGASSPAITKAIEELSLSQLFSHIEMPSEKKFQVVQPSSRVSVFETVQETSRELAREFLVAESEISRVLTEIGKYSSDFEKLLQNDLVIPPENFFERRDFSRAVVQNPFAGTPGLNLFEKLGVEGDFRTLLEVLPRLLGAGLEQLSPWVVARCIGSWFFDIKCIQGGLDAFRQLLCERIVEQGGDVQEGYTAEGIVTKRGKVQGVRMRGRKESTATQIVLTDFCPTQLSCLVEPSEWTSRFKALVEDDSHPTMGYALNLGVKKEVVPVGMAHTVLLSTADTLGAGLLRIEQVPQEDDSKCALNISCVVPDSEDAISSGALRDAILDKIRWLVPYLDNFLEVIHSPFDGFGPIDLTGNAESAAPPVPHPEQIQKWFLQSPRDCAGVGIEKSPHRTGIKGLLMAGSQVTCGLGVETDFIAAWGAAKIAGKMDPSRQRLARSMRSKVEI